MMSRNARWFYHGKALFHMVAPKYTYHNWPKVVAKLVAKNDSVILASRVLHSWPVERKKLSKQGHIKSVDQYMLSGKDWVNFFKNPESKKI